MVLFSSEWQIIMKESLLAAYKALILARSFRMQLAALLGRAGVEALYCKSNCHEV